MNNNDELQDVVIESVYEADVDVDELLENQEEFGDFDAPDDSDESWGQIFAIPEEDTGDAQLEEIDPEGVRFDSSRPESYANNPTADRDGSVIDADVLKQEDYEDDFVNSIGAFSGGGVMSETGEIVVMDNDGTPAFELQYINIKNIAIPKRIRQATNVEGLVRSIRSTGMLQPITVAPTVTEGIFSLVHGMRRLLAAYRLGMPTVPCLINTKISTTEIPIVEALCNHHRQYSVKELVGYIDYLEKQMGIMSASMIEYLCQMNSGDYTKLKDILEDDDDDIVSKMMNDQMTISEAFKKLEQRRKKESKDERENKRAEKVYENAEESGVDRLEDTGESSGRHKLNDEEIAELLAGGESTLEEEFNEEDFKERVKESQSMEGYQAHKQDSRDREKIDPKLKSAVLSRDKSRCQCCGIGGPGWEPALDFHHKIPVFLGGPDSAENGITLCTRCHILIHVYSYGNLHVVIDDMTLEEKKIYSNIMKYGDMIRNGMKQAGIELKKAKEEHPAHTVGRRMPGSSQTVG
jgi:5-methylcytosine-specific restriction protein A